MCKIENSAKQIVIVWQQSNQIFRMKMTTVTATGIPRETLAQWVQQFLRVDAFKDYAPNGLQLQGQTQVQHIVLGVTACKALLQAAIDKGADTVMVHHGWFWKSEPVTITGMKHGRIALALSHGLNVFGYHLPLDAHPVVGNNAQLAVQLGLRPFIIDGQPETCGDQGLIWLGAPDRPGTTLGELADTVAQRLGRAPLCIGDPQQVLQRVAWCTGGAQGYFETAIQHGVQAFITGEASEPVFHIAQEYGVGFIGAGHHATERYGIQALGQAIAKAFPQLKIEYVDIDNPI